MGPRIIIPLVLLAIVLPLGFVWARRLKTPVDLTQVEAPAPAARLTSTALRSLPSPPWRVVHEIGTDRLGGVAHVLIGPAGVFALQTSMDTLPGAGVPQPEAQQVARAAIVRGALDDALRRCAMTSDRLVTVFWGAGATSTSVELLPGSTGVDGRAIAAWTESLPSAALTAAQVDLAWQTVVTAIGRPDPLA